MRIAITIGDPNGIGPEIAVKAARKFAGGPVEPVLVGDEFVIRKYGGEGLAIAPVEALDPAGFLPGKVDPRAGKATVAYVREAVRLVNAGEVSAIVACPQSETAINGAGIPFSGYAGLLAQLTETPEDQVFLMLVAAGMRIAHVTLHESVKSALARITTERVVAAGLAWASQTRNWACSGSTRTRARAVFSATTMTASPCPQWRGCANWVCWPTARWART